MFFAAVNLMLTGDFQGWMRPYLGEEDGWVVDMLLAMVGL